MLVSGSFDYLQLDWVLFDSLDTMGPLRLDCAIELEWIESILDELVELLMIVVVLRPSGDCKTEFHPEYDDITLKIST
jgi:hypothetical protein